MKRISSRFNGINNNMTQTIEIYINNTYNKKWGKTINEFYFYFLKFNSIFFHNFFHN